MKWKRGDQYYIYTEGWTIARTNVGPVRIYTLWNATTREHVASRRAITDFEATQAIEELKDEALRRSP